MKTFDNRSCTGCAMTVGRRHFLTTAGASAVALNMGVLDFASSLFADEPKPAKKPVIRAVFIGWKTQDEYWMTWPGMAYDANKHQGLYTKTMSEAADKLGIQLEVTTERIDKPDAVNPILEQLKKSPPDGLLVTVMCNQHWDLVNRLIDERGDIPAIVFSPMGSSFTGHVQRVRNAPRCYLASTQDCGWLAEGMRMFKVMRDMKNTRLCIIKGNKTGDQVLAGIGTTLHTIPLKRFPDELKKVETTDEMRAIAAYYTKEAKKIVEPDKEDILNAAKNYVVARRIMAAENCQGISMDCLPLVAAIHRDRPSWCKNRMIDSSIQPPCLAWSKINDEGLVAACEADWNAGISMRLTQLLFGRPGFMQDPIPNTINNTLMGAHCSCPTKLNGPDKPHEPFLLRSHSESNEGVAPQVLWRIGQKVTVMKFQGPGQIILGTGRVVSNIDTPPSGGCRTSVELAVDNMEDSLDCKGFHQLFIYGKLDRQFKAYCRLAGIKVVPV